MKKVFESFKEHWLNESHLTSINEGQYEKVRSYIEKTKRELIKKWKAKGGYENFGQKEIEEIEKRFNYNPYGSKEEREIASLIRTFDEWCMNYDGSSLNEKRDDEYAEYTVKKDKVIATLKNQRASQFTKFAKTWSELNKQVDLFTEEKRRLNELKNEIEAKKDALHKDLREGISELFDDGESLMTLTVECLGSSFTLSKAAEAKPDVITTNVNYVKILEELQEFVAGKDGLQEKFEEITNKYTEIIVTAGKIPERGLRVQVKENIFSDIWSKVVQITQGFTKMFKKWFSKKESELERINKEIEKLEL